VTRQLAEKASAEGTSSTLTPQQVNSVYKCIGKFIGFMFKKNQVNWVIADIFSFGTVIRNNATGGPSEFIPASLL